MNTLIQPELMVVPTQAPVPWKEFTSKYVGGSIALDGFVDSAPRYDPTGPYLNADHHSGGERMAMLSTTGQIQRYLQLGLRDAFTSDGVYSPKVWVNDCDKDVCTAWWLLSRPDAAFNVGNTLLKRFIEVVDVVDATVGAVPLGHQLDELASQAWVFEPYTTFRSSGEMAQKEAGKYRDVIDQVLKRIDLHIVGEGKTIPVDTRYEVLEVGSGWSLVNEIGANAKIGMFADGIDAYVSVQNEGTGRWRYTLGRRSMFVPFDLLPLYSRLNRIEQCTDDRWGGSSTVGGSPRVSSSSIPPDRMKQIIEDYMDVTSKG